MITRRACLTAASAAIAAPVVLADNNDQERNFDAASPLPHKDAFSSFDGTYLNSASQHPVSIGAREAVNRYLDYKTFASPDDYSYIRTYYDLLGKLARLINADEDEVAFVQSTTVGENLVMKALGIPGSGGRIVTDELHYVGSQPTYAQLAECGMDIVTLRAGDDGRIAIEQFQKAINDETRLVAISYVSMLNGFHHNLSDICRLAHANGAYVYADIVQAVGSVPFDVRESGVDFCASTSYKWLMGEQGLGFIFARKDRLPELERPWYGHYQLDRRTALGFPGPETSGPVTEFAHAEGARGYFAMGSQANIVAALLDYSVDYLLRAGVERIAAHRQPLIERLQVELPALGYAPLTPHHHLRISPSVFNDMKDIERLISALA
jgi:selenocysteine lyase/cysteine desulfurase